MNTCETRKIAVNENDSDTGGDISDDDVIVLNPVNDSACNLQCAVGWYHSQHGNKAPFSCAAETKDRSSSEGIRTDPISCSSACVAMVFVSMMTGACIIRLTSVCDWGCGYCRVQVSLIGIQY